MYHLLHNGCKISSASGGIPESLRLRCHWGWGNRTDFRAGTRVGFKYIESGQQKSLLSQILLPLSKPLLRPMVSFLIPGLQRIECKAQVSPTPMAACEVTWDFPICYYQLARARRVGDCQGESETGLLACQPFPVPGPTCRLSGSRKAHTAGEP